MIYFHFSIYFIIHFLIPISKAMSHFQTDDEGFIAFAKGQKNFDKFCEEKRFQNCEYSAHKYEAHLGVLYWMRKNWNCAEIDETFENFERNECQKYRKYLDILYEYLFREFVGFPSVKPKFMFKDGEFEFENVGPLIYAVNILTEICKFYFETRYSEIYHYKLVELFEYKFIFEPNLMNLHKLNFETKKLDNSSKVTNDQQQEMDIVQLAIDLDNQTQTNEENVDGFYRKNFDKKLEKIFLKAKKRAMEGLSQENLLNFKICDIILGSRYDDLWTWKSDLKIIEFVKRKATNSDKLIKRTLGNVCKMMKNWHCDKIGHENEEKLKNDKREECEKFRKYLYILHEYLFRQYVRAKYPEIGKQMAAEVKPIFWRYGTKTIIYVVEMLYSIWNWLNELGRLPSFLNDWTLLNEGEINYFYGQENWEKKHSMPKMGKNKATKIVMKIVGRSLTKIDNLREEFDKMMEQMSKT